MVLLCYYGEFYHRKRLCVLGWWTFTFTFSTEESYLIRDSFWQPKTNFLHNAVTTRTCDCILGAGTERCYPTNAKHNLLHAACACTYTIILLSISAVPISPLVSSPFCMFPVSGDNGKRFTWRYSQSRWSLVARGQCQRKTQDARARRAASLEPHPHKPTVTVPPNSGHLQFEFEFSVPGGWRMVGWGWAECGVWMIHGCGCGCGCGCEIDCDCECEFCCNISCYAPHTHTLYYTSLYSAFYIYNI